MSNEQDELLQRLTRVETKLDHVIENQENRVLQVERNVDKVFVEVDRRVSKVEEAVQWIQRGLVGALFTAIIALIGMILK